MAKVNSVIERQNSQFLEQNNLAGVDLNKHLVAQFFISMWETGSEEMSDSCPNSPYQCEKTSHLEI